MRFTINSTIGFCGNSGCTLGLKQTPGNGSNKTMSPESDCKYFYGLTQTQRKKLLINHVVQMDQSNAICVNLYIGPII